MDQTGRRSCRRELHEDVGRKPCYRQARIPLRSWKERLPGSQTLQQVFPQALAPRKGCSKSAHPQAAAAGSHKGLCSGSEVSMWCSFRWNKKCVVWQELPSEQPWWDGPEKCPQISSCLTVLPSHCSESSQEGAFSCVFCPSEDIWCCYKPTGADTGGVCTSTAGDVHLLCDGKEKGHRLHSPSYAKGRRVCTQQS